MALNQVLRRYELFKKAFPNVAPLMDSLKSDTSMILWFRHNDGKGCFLVDFQLSRIFNRDNKEGVESKSKCY